MVVAHEKIMGTERTNRWDVPLLFICIALLTITFNGIQVVSGVALADVFLVISAVLMLATSLLSRQYRLSSVPHPRTLWMD